jgi:hypothetical protein
VFDSVSSVEQVEFKVDVTCGKCDGKDCEPKIDFIPEIVVTRTGAKAGFRPYKPLEQGGNESGSNGGGSFWVNPYGQFELNLRVSVYCARDGCDNSTTVKTSIKARWGDKLAEYEAAEKEAQKK